MRNTLMESRQCAKYDGPRSWVFEGESSFHMSSPSLSPLSTFVLVVRYVPHFGLKVVVPRAVIEECRKCCSWM